MENIAIVTNIITSYRENFFDKVTQIGNYNITIFCQDSIPGQNLKCVHIKYRKKLQLVKYFGLKNEKLGIQLLPYRNILLNYDTICITGNPRIISNLFLGFLGLALKKRIIIWCNAHSFGAKKFTEIIRLKWLSMFKNIFLYMDSEVTILQNKGFNKQLLVAMNNGLDQNNIETIKSTWDSSRLETWQNIHGLNNKTILVSIARLEPKNNFKQIIYALHVLKEKIPNIHWCVIGDGIERQNLKDLTRVLKLENYISFVGRLFEENDIAPYMLSASLFVHPSSIGLSLMHAYGYALPVIIDDNKTMHGPEHLAFTDSVNGYYFSKNNITDLSNKILFLLTNMEIAKKIRKENLKLVKEQYNSDRMIERFKQIIQEAT